MSEELEGTEERSGLGRRDFLRRSAIVGGMVWAAPMIQSAPAFAQGFTPDGEENGGGQNISYLALVIYNLDPNLRWKFEGGGSDCGLEAGGNIDNNCENLLSDAQKADWNAASGGPSNHSSMFSIDCSNKAVWTITPTANYGVKWALVKSGSQNMCSLFGESPKGQAVQVFQQTP